MLHEVVDDPALELERHDLEQKHTDGQQQEEQLVLGQWPLIATNGICLVLQTQTDGSSDATASLGLAVSLCAVCRPIAVDHGFT